MSFLDTLATPIARTLQGIHAGLATVLPSGSGWTWGLSVVLLTVTVRIVLFPLFVKQIKSQRRMQELSPKIKALQAKHKGDRETLNTELMKLYKDHGTNPISGCLPLLLQMPVFFALFRVMNEFKPQDGRFIGKFGLSDDLIAEAARAKVFGAPLSSAFTSDSGLLDLLDGNANIVKVVATVMIVTMGATTFFTQKQMMARNGAPTDPQQAQIQKVMLYVLPLSFAVFGFNFPIGVLLYWLTTNIWSMGQQYYVIKRMPPITPGGSGTAGPGPKGGKGPEGPKGPGGDGPKGGSPAPEGPTASTGTVTLTKPRPAGGSTPTRPTGRAAGSRKNKSRKGGRR